MMKRLVGSSFGQPRQGARDHGLNACLQGWIYNGGEQGTVIDRQVVDPPRGLRFGVNIGIGAADKPVDRRRVPFTPEAAEVLARRRWSGVADAVGREMAAQGLRHAIACLLVVDIEGVAIQRCDLRRCAVRRKPALRR